MKTKGILSMTAAAILALASQSALADGDAAKGEKVFKKCKACHALEEGKKKIGPSLYGIFGKAAGTTEGFKYSKAMAGSGVTWDEETLATYLENPKKYIPGNRMAFPGLKKEDDRENLIAYLKDATK